MDELDRRRVSQRLARLARILVDTRELNSDVRDAQSEITLLEAREIMRACREAEGWLAGVRTVLLDLEQGPDMTERPG